MPKRRTLTMLLVTAALPGCGSDEDYANNPRPPAPINVTAAVTDRGITVSPDTFGAGPVVFIIANQTGSAQEVTIETDELGGSEPGIRQTTSAINPSGTATLKVDMREGDYEMRAGGGGIDPAPITVEDQRPSSQNELLQP
jgi:hypothetical protein